MFMGGYLRFWRVGKVLEASVIGVVCLLLAVWGGKLVYDEPGSWPSCFGLQRHHSGLGDHRLRPGGERAAGLAAAGAARLPQHVHEAGHHLRAGAAGSSWCCPTCRCRRSAGSWTARGWWWPGRSFPFCFITIACGAISGFHTLIASGTTPKIITRETLRAADRLRRDVPGIAGGHHGADRGLHAGAGRLPQHERQRRSRGDGGEGDGARASR